MESMSTPGGSAGHPLLENPALLSIEGIVGSGKTTLAQRLKEHLPWLVFVEEDLRSWRNLPTPSGPVNLLQRFYEDPHNHALEFQSLVMQTLGERHLNRGNFYIQERSLQSSVNVFAESQRELGYLRDDQYAILKGWNDLLKGVPYRMTSPNAFLYVDVDPQTAFSRVQARGRSEEASVTVDYLADLKRLHDKWLLNEQEYSVFRVDGTLPMNRLVPGIVAQLEKWRLCEVFRASALPKGLSDIVLDIPLPGKPAGEGDE
jgi:deoxyadenosine/deoxycytidine kinase